MRSSEQPSLTRIGNHSKLKLGGADRVFDPLAQMPNVPALKELAETIDTPKQNLTKLGFSGSRALNKRMPAAPSLRNFAKTTSLNKPSLKKPAVKASAPVTSRGKDSIGSPRE